MEAEATQKGIYANHRIVFIGACIFLMLASMMRMMIIHIHSLPTTKQSAESFNYNPRVCDEAWQNEFHHENDETDHIPVTLHEGCFSGNLYLPKIWKAWWVQPTGDQAGDWIAYWMPGSSPVGPYAPNARYQFPGTPLDFRLQGHGKYVFYSNIKVSTKHVEPTDASPNIPKSEQAQASPPTPEKVYVLSHLVPTSGVDGDYEFAIEQCHHLGSQIRCAGKATNKLDTLVYLWLRESNAVDDQGHNVEIGSGSNAFFWSGAAFDALNEARLIPNTPTQFQIYINDSDLNVKTINLVLRTLWDAGKKDDELIFQGVPVQ